MSDQKLRDLERRWKETGSPDDEAAYLLERVRVGDLSRERLELAAYYGQGGASRACATFAPTRDEWIQGLAKLDRFDLIRVGVVVLETALQGIDDGEAASYTRDVIDCTTRYLQCPCADHRTECCLRLLLGKHPPAYQAGNAIVHAVWDETVAGTRSDIVKGLNEGLKLVIANDPWLLLRKEMGARLGTPLLAQNE